MRHVDPPLIKMTWNELLPYRSCVEFIVRLRSPDYNGERIRKIIMQEIPQAKHAFLNRGEAVPKSKTKGRSLGVEHVQLERLGKSPCWTGGLL